jgi:anti-anti-sigma regulatory factor/predicted transport protein
MEKQLKVCIQMLDSAVHGDFSIKAPEESEITEIAELSKRLNLMVKMYKESMDDAMEMAIVVYQYVEALGKIMKGDFKVTVATDSRIDILNTLGQSINTAARSTEKMMVIEKLLQEVSTPSLKLWDEIIAMPIIGTMTSKRANDAMHTILREIVDKNARVAIIDITGVPIIDTMVADYLIKTVKAIKILGAEPIITGVSPQVASTLVTLQIDIGDFTTKSKLSEGFKYALALLGKKVEEDKSNAK